MLSRFVWIIGILACLACAKPRGETPQSLYVTWMDRVKTPVTVTLPEIDGIWERTGEIRLYRDTFDEKYNDAIGTTIDKSGDFLLVTDGKAAKEYLRFSCPYNGEEPVFLLTGYNPEDPAHSPGLDPNAFLASLATNQPTAFAPFALDGQKIVTDQILRGPKPSKEKPEEFKPEHFDIKIIAFSPNEMQIAYQRNDTEFGVHTIIETYQRITGQALVDRLKQSKEAKPCPK